MPSGQMSSVRLIAVTKPVIDHAQTAEDLIAYAARVSNPANQSAGENSARLLRYCIRNGHWSVFETASMTVEIETTRAIAAQILRHRSFTFQEFSQRYAVADTDPEPQQARSQDPVNRQASNDDLSSEVRAWWHEAQSRAFELATETYVAALEKGIARECARFVLPLATPTRLYMTGNVRDWIHYLNLRTGNGTQKEHADVARQIQTVFIETFPIISEALGM